MKRLIVALLVGGTLFAAAFGLAVTQNITSGGTAAEGVAVPDSCDHLNLDWGHNAGGQIDVVDIEASASDCAGKKVSVHAQDSSHVTLDSGTTTLDASGDGFIILAAFSAQALHHAHVVVTDF